jgi:methionyl-tRNA formyltransferase
LKKIVYMGTPHYAKEILQTLIDDKEIEIPLVITQPDRKAGRRGDLKPPAVKVLAVKYNLEILQPEKLSDEGVYEAIIKTEPDYIIVAAFGQLLPKNILDIAPCINLHASILPQYRGASPVQQSLLNGDEKTGVTSMLMEEGLDTGDILKIKEFIIPPTMRLYALMAQLTKDACVLTLETIREFSLITPVPQDDSKASLCKKIKKSDGKIDFVDAKVIYNKYRAFEGWPGIFSEDGVKFDDVVLLDATSNHNAKEILEFVDDAVVVGCKSGSLQIGTIQPPSKKQMSAKAYCVGRGKRVGDSIV